MAPEAPTVAAVRLANARRADEVVEALVAHGVRLFFVAPGSRSTPLVLALVRAGVETHVVLDERGAAFQALGAARTGTPAAVVTTSGTAVANLLPACAEAARDHVAFVCCTADRPRADVQRGASQTLPQPPLLSGAVRHVLDLPAPTGREDPPARDELDAALLHLVGPDAGPVHLNVRFDKPLEPPAGYASQAPTGRPQAPSTRAERATTGEGRPAALRWDDAHPLERPGLVVVGLLPAAARDGAARLLERLGWPVVADVTSGVVPAATLARLPTLALRSARVRSVLRPRSVLWLGGLTTEDAVPLWLREVRAQAGCRVTLVSTNATHRDPFGLADEVRHFPAQWLSSLADGAAGADAELAALVRRIAAATTLVQSSLDLPEDDEETTEPAVARLVLSSVGRDETLLLGNSMPVRDADRFGELARGAQLIVNRGAAGIDGCVSTAIGACLATRRPTTALLGDLAVLHDLSSLAALAGLEPNRTPLRVVVVNNAGGGIFSFLPVGDRVDAETMRRFFETPHAVRLARVAASVGLRSTTVRDLAALRERLAAPPDGPELIEVVTDRRTNVSAHRRLDEQLDAAVARTLEEQP
jgi:2-succinyl-5-enolpyruvyl-6-hydroxy-3-cyclohexene-1-carboxylate synthase